MKTSKLSDLNIFHSFIGVERDFLRLSFIQSTLTAYDLVQVIGVKIMKKMVDLFTGLAGFTLAGHRTGKIETIFTSEIDSYNVKFIAQNLELENAGDINFVCVWSPIILILPCVKKSTLCPQKSLVLAH